MSIATTSRGRAKPADGVFLAEFAHVTPKYPCPRCSQKCYENPPWTIGTIDFSSTPQGQDPKSTAGGGGGEEADDTETGFYRSVHRGLLPPASDDWKSNHQQQQLLLRRSTEPVPDARAAISQRIQDAAEAHFRDHHPAQDAQISIVELQAARVLWKSLGTGVDLLRVPLHDLEQQLGLVSARGHMDHIRIEYTVTYVPDLVRLAI